MKKTDIIIIGGGIAGCSAGALLCDSANIIILEQEDTPGYHSTGRSAATLAPFYGPPAIRQLTALSAPFLNSPPDSISDRAFTGPRGEMMLVGNRPNLQSTPHADTDSIKALIEDSLAHGMQSLAVAEAQQLVPLLKAEAIEQVLYTEKLVSIDVDALHQAYIKKIRRSGGEIVCSAPVQDLNYNDKLWHVTVDKGSANKHNTTDSQYQAPIVINAAGAWADIIAKMADLPATGMQPKRRSAALVPFLEHTKMESWPMLLDIQEQFYSIPFGSGLLISPADETPVDAHDAWPEEIDLATGIDQFQQLINYEVQTISHRWAGLRTFVPDGNPVVGFDPLAPPGFFWLAGQGGYGIQTSPAIAQLCDHVINRQASEHTDAFNALESQLSPARLSR